MTTIRIKPDETDLEPKRGETILTAALREGAPFAHVCGGNARCSTCRVVIVDGLECCGPRTSSEQAIAERLSLSADIRLACQTVVDQDVTARRLVLDDRDVELTSALLNGRSLQKVGVEKQVAILFADIRAFTTFSEAVLPYDVVHVLNRYFQQMEEVIVDRGGRIDNYMGDGLLALFEHSSPTEAARAAVTAGLDMLRCVDDEVRPYLVELFSHNFDIGVGIHHGLVVSGTIGGSKSKRATVIGDAVNFAARVEAANRAAGTRLLVSDAVIALIGDDVEIGRRETVDIKGKTGRHTLYEVIGQVGEGVLF